MVKYEQTTSVYELNDLPNIETILRFIGLTLHPTNRLNSKRYGFNIKVLNAHIRGRNIKEHTTQLFNLNPEIGIATTCVIDPEFPEKNYTIFYVWVTRKFKLPRKYIPPAES